MDNPTPNYFPSRLLCFDSKGEGDVSSEDSWLKVEIVDSGDGFAEIAWDDRNERVFLSFRVSDLLRAIKEKN